MLRRFHSMTAIKMQFNRCQSATPDRTRLSLLLPQGQVLYRALQWLDGRGSRPGPDTTICILNVQFKPQCL
jgi:hypothetical protein